jgi:Oxidoreductase family, NAD-binding Rossmann fold
MKQTLKLGMLGMVDGNGHPYSWSAIINGKYDAERIADSGFSMIPEYLDAQPEEALGIPGAAVTHIWCDNPADAQKVADATYIPTVVERPEDVIGQVDAVIIPTDRGDEHVARSRPFIEAGLPVFIDKPLADNEDDLKQFIRWQAEGKAILSTSCMRYAKEYADCRDRISELGELRLITNTTPKSWERYGIHALEGVYPLLRPSGWEWVINTGTEDANIIHIHHQDDVEIVLSAIHDMYGGLGHLGLHGTKGSLTTHFEDTFHAFKTQLVGFIEYLRTGELPFPFDETVELMKIIIAGIRSRNECGRRICLSEIEV